MSEEDYNQENKPTGVAEDVSKILTDLLKTIKVVSVYPENNPIPVRLKESFVERFTDLIQDNKKLSFMISSGVIHYNGEIVYEDDSTEDSLADIFFNAGMTEISFNDDFDYKEAQQFFKVLKAYINKEPGAEDLAALFWQVDIDGFNYITVEDVALGEYEGDFRVQETCVDDGSFIRHSGADDSGGLQYSAIFLDDDDEDDAVEQNKCAGEGYVDNSEANDFAANTGFPVASSLPAGFMPTGKKSADVAAGSPGGGRALPDTTLILNEAFKLDREELDRVADLVNEDGGFNEFQDTIELLQEMLRQEIEFQDFSEVVILVEKIQSEFIKFGNLHAAGRVIDGLEEIGENLKNDDPRFKERIHNALVMSGGWERLSDLAEVLNSDSSIPAASLVMYLKHFGWESLSTITDLLGIFEHRAHREAICDYLVDHGSDHIDIISKGIFDRRWFVVRNTAAVLARIGNDEALPYLEKAIGHDDFRVRFQVAQGLCEKPSEDNIELLLKLVWDHDDRVQATAIGAIFELPDNIQLNTIIKIINSDRFATLSEMNQARMILTLSDMGGEHAVAYLTSLISAGGLFRNQVKDFYRQIAFKALSQNMSEKAEQALLKFSRSWRKKLRRMAARSLKERRELKYKADNE